MCISSTLASTRAVPLAICRDAALIGCSLRRHAYCGRLDSAASIAWREPQANFEPHPLLDIRRCPTNREEFLDTTVSIHHTSIDLRNAHGATTSRSPCAASVHDLPSCVGDKRVPQLDPGPHCSQLTVRPIARSHALPHSRLARPPSLRALICRACYKEGYGVPKSWRESSGTSTWIMSYHVVPIIPSLSSRTCIGYFTSRSYTAFRHPPSFRHAKNKCPSPST